MVKYTTFTIWELEIRNRMQLKSETDKALSSLKRSQDMSSTVVLYLLTISNSHPLVDNLMKSISSVVDIVLLLTRQQEVKY